MAVEIKLSPVGKLVLSMAWLVLLSKPAEAQITELDGLPGRYCIPYLSVGPAGNKVWENYRKQITVAVPAASPVKTLPTADPEHTHYTGLKQGYLGAGSAFYAPGVFVGTVPSLRDYDSTQFYLVSAAQSDGTPISFDLRLGFAETSADGGGHTFSQFVQNHGGDNGQMDFFYGKFGVDALFFHLVVNDQGATSIVGSSGGNLVAAESLSDEPDRHVYSDSVRPLSLPSIVSPDAVGVSYDTGIPVSTPLNLRWNLSPRKAPS